MKKWYPCCDGSSPEDLEDYKKRLLKSSDVVDVKIEQLYPHIWELSFAKELTSDEEMEVKTRQTSLQEVIK